MPKTLPALAENAVRDAHCVPLARAVLLIDADNFHQPAELRAIHSQYAQHVGKGFMCRVHGAARVVHAEHLRPVWADMGAELLPQLPLPAHKNTTDAGLIVDALALHFQQGVRRFAIASGDADFAPLAVRLRQWGCEVWCFARMANAFDSMVTYYDRVVRFDVPPGPAPNAAVVTPGDPIAHPMVRVPPAPTVAPPLPTRAPIPAAGSATKQARAPSSAVAKPASGQTDGTSATDEATLARAIVAALPGWLPDTVKRLNLLGAPLRAAGVKTGNAPLHQLFRKCPHYFRVLPVTGLPTQVRLLRKP